MIPTASKDRLPEGFTYPWGAQAISTALEGAPGLEDARIWFSWRDQFWASEWRQKIAELGEIILLEVGPRYLGGFGRQGLCGAIRVLHGGTGTIDLGISDAPTGAGCRR